MTASQCCCFNDILVTCQSESVLARGSSDGNKQLQPDNGGASPSVMGTVGGRGGYNLYLELDFNLRDFTFVFVIFGFSPCSFTHFVIIHIWPSNDYFILCAIFLIATAVVFLHYVPLTNLPA